MLETPNSPTYTLEEVFTTRSKRDRIVTRVVPAKINSDDFFDLTAGMSFWALYEQSAV